MRCLQCEADMHETIEHVLLGFPRYAQLMNVVYEVSFTNESDEDMDA